jgi:ornithine cyclodeaminase
MHVNGIGGDCPGKTEVGACVLDQARVVVEYAPQSRIEGDIQQMPADFPVTELFEVLTGKATGRASDEEITVFDSVGFALEDFSALCVVHKLAMEHGIGTTLNLIPEMADVKDLFSQVSVAGAVSR